MPSHLEKSFQSFTIVLLDAKVTENTIPPNVKGSITFLRCADVFHKRIHLWKSSYCISHKRTLGCLPMAAQCDLQPSPQTCHYFFKIRSSQIPIIAHHVPLAFRLESSNHIPFKAPNQLKKKKKNLRPNSLVIYASHNNHTAANGSPFGTPSASHEEALRESLNSSLRATKTAHEVIELLLHGLSNNFLPLALLSMTLAGILWPIPGQVAQHWGLSRWVVSSIFLISGLTLQDGEFAKAVEAWPLGLFGLASILLFTPMAAYILLQIRLSPPELVTGLAIFCCVPTTISSGVSLTQLVGGNATLALALTVISNLFGIFTMPVMLSMLFSHGIGVSIPVQPLLSSLLQALLLPLFIGKGIRTSSLAVKSFVDRRRHKFSMLTSALLSLVPWMQISSSINVLLQTKVASLVMSFSLGLFLHILFLAWNSIAMKIICRYLGNKDGDKTSTRAIILVASQKTLPVTVAVVENIGGALGAAGLLVLPCVAAHLTQILIDALLVNIWLQQDRNQGSDLVTNHTHKHSS